MGEFVTKKEFDETISKLVEAMHEVNYKFDDMDDKIEKIRSENEDKIQDIEEEISSLGD